MFLRIYFVISSSANHLQRHCEDKELRRFPSRYEIWCPNRHLWRKGEHGWVILRYHLTKTSFTFSMRPQWRTSLYLRKRFFLHLGHLGHTWSGRWVLIHLCTVLPLSVTPSHQHHIDTLSPTPYWHPLTNTVLTPSGNWLNTLGN